MTIPSQPHSWTRERLAIYQLVRAWECGAQTIHRIRKFAGAHVSDFLTSQDAWRETRLSDKQCKSLSASVRADLEGEFRELEEQGITFLLPEDPDFPRALKTIPDPPAAIFVRGAIPHDGLRIAVIGTRGMTSYGKRCAETLVQQLQASQATVISGLAFGIDACAHRASLSCDIQTIAVVPSGVSDTSIMPQSHVKLAHEILYAHGTILSEHAPRTPTLPYLYLHRNRLISGLADATIVIEAGRQSGALTTAKLALEQGRDVLAVPGSIWSEASQGTNQLIKDGATPCTCVDDVWQAIGVRHAEHAARISTSRIQFPMTEAESALLHFLTEPRSADDLVRLSNQSPSEIGSLLSILEIKGRVVQEEPGMYGKREW